MVADVFGVGLFVAVGGFVDVCDLGCVVLWFGYDG